LTEGWAGPTWGEPSTALSGPPPLRPLATSASASYRAEGGRSEDFLVLGACVAGTSHRLARRRCEDCYAWVQPGQRRLALLVADGVGSAGRGGEGAELALDAACEHLAQVPQAQSAATGGLLAPDVAAGTPVGPATFGWGEAECAAAIAAASQALTSSAGPSARELATTIVVALVQLDAMGGHGTGPDARAQVALGRVGDSSAFVLSPDGSWRELFTAGGSTPAAEEAERLIGAATAVLPVACPPGPIEFSTAQLSAGEALVLVSDGVAEPLRDGPKTVAPRLAEVLERARSGKLGPLELATALDFSRRGAHDDRTVLVAWAIGC